MGGSSSFSTSSSFATASSTVITPSSSMPVNVLASDPALRHAILDSNHVFALFAIADAYTADPPLLSAFCTLLSPLLPHLPLSRSPFPILTRGRLLRALFHSVMSTAALDMSAMAVEAALASSAHRNGLYVLSDALHRVCSAAGDAEFYSFGWLAVDEMVKVAEYLKVATFHAINSGWGQWVEPWAVKGWVKIVRHLHDREYVSIIVSFDPN
ncbi:hypothetical protein BCR44DRAFT_1423906 [Catenaria anguillulae PL171]|uniref:Uncharacterized protein n=1 Tax=Catenaria anguillulae PL171 TaxID=765915 RepID=A0A1Y2I275_9FUNG|nr:hypothetical protein BCR44DRAFT_1423906 [Catenaria anguillulae PL171]